MACIRGRKRPFACEPAYFSEDGFSHRTNSGDVLPFERIARGLAELNDNQDTFRRWLNTPNPELSDFTPLQVIEKGKADAVADMVSSALLGQPA
jgi:hypothetical protein